MEMHICTRAQNMRIPMNGNYALHTSFSRSFQCYCFDSPIVFKVLIKAYQLYTTSQRCAKNNFRAQNYLQSQVFAFY